MKYKKLLSSLLILGASLGFAGTALASANYNALIIGYTSFAQLNKTTTFILYCPGTSQLTATPENVNHKMVSASSYAGKNCQLRLRGLNNSGNYTTVPLANFTFVNNNGLLSVENFQPTTRGEAGHPTGIYIKLLGKLVALKTNSLIHANTAGIINEFTFSDLPPIPPKQ